MGFFYRLLFMPQLLELICSGQIPFSRVSFTKHVKKPTRLLIYIWIFFVHIFHACDCLSAFLFYNSSPLIMGILLLSCSFWHFLQINNSKKKKMFKLQSLEKSMISKIARSLALVNKFNQSYGVAIF